MISFFKKSFKFFKYWFRKKILLKHCPSSYKLKIHLLKKKKLLILFLCTNSLPRSHKKATITKMYATHEGYRLVDLYKIILFTCKN
jgi:hypothetical protein